MSSHKIFSKNNLILAWKRISTNKDAKYKSYYRTIMEAYELSYRENIDDLWHKVNNHLYKPEAPIRIYYPKSSGLQRPITLLCTEDQIILQAIANICAEKIRYRRQKLVGKAIFSNWLTRKEYHDFFLDDWKYGFYELRKKLLHHYSNGNTWMANFDLTAFYDTIPHDLILKCKIRSKSHSNSGGNRTVIPEQIAQ